MAFATVITTTEEVNLGVVVDNLHDVYLPVGMQVGDLLVVFMGHAVAMSLNALSGWTEIVDNAVTNGEKWLWRSVDGSEAVGDIQMTSDIASKSASFLWLIRGTEQSVTTLIEPSTVATGTSTQPNATTCTPSAGAQDYLWLTAAVNAGEEADDDTWGGAAPASFGNAIYKTTGNSGLTASNVSIQGADYSVNAASLDAGAWGANAQSKAWRAWTLAIRWSLPANSDSWGWSEGTTDTWGIKT